MATEGASSKPEPDLVGREAWQWFLDRGPAAPHLFDFSLSVVPDVFGPDHRVGALVPFSASRRRRWEFFLAIEGRPDRADDWNRLVELQERYLGLADLIASDGAARIADRFHPVLIGEPPEAIAVRDAWESWR